MVSGLIVIFLWKSFYASDGLFNQLLGYLGINVNTNWLTEPGTALVSCILPGIWAGMGPGCLIYLAALKGIPDDLYEAGDLDGAGFLNCKSWAEVRPRFYGLNRLMELSTPLPERSLRFRATRPIEDLCFADLEAHWKSVTLLPRYERKIETYRQKTGVPVTSWDGVHLSQNPPPASNTLARADWEVYVRQRVPFPFLRLAPPAAPLYRSYLQSAYGDNLKRLNKAHGTTYVSFDEIPLSPDHGFVDFNRFVREKVPLEMLSLDGPTFRYRDFLREKFHNDIAAARSAYNVSWTSFDHVSLPTAAMDWHDFEQQKSKLRREFLTRNYEYVLDFLARHGRGFQNTGILVVLFLVTHLTVNPLAAYALSRFGLPTTYKILLFCMATVAFPGEVMMIPSFLQLKELRLLNTFWALVLPGLASGYSIFLLKGFFDSLPRELYESATIDGASEWTIFWQITMSLSKPILAVMALGSFTAAYGTFFYALIICPDQKMWTLMVWLYQLQMTGSSQAINYAALCLASIPTLLVFVFCQRIIMRGIVVPSEK
jgi:multiple sugar transport system permease protein